MQVAVKKIVSSEFMLVDAETAIRGVMEGVAEFLPGSLIDAESLNKALFGINHVYSRSPGGEGDQPKGQTDT